jgi:uncharacterized delta-60 repeat protein
MSPFRYLVQALFLVSVLFTFLLLSPLLALAQGPGDLDPSFDGDGLVTTNFVENRSGLAHAVALQPDGKIVVAGDSASDFALARYEADGSLDPTFDGDGKVMTNFNSDDYSTAYALALQPDGKIVAAGYTIVSNHDFALARYNVDGSLDVSFDGDGKVTTDFNGNSTDRARDLVLQADGKIVVVGDIFNSPNSYDIVLARYNSDGSLDSTFDGDGVTSIEKGAASAVALQSDNKIIVAGVSSNGSNSDFALIRYNIDGSLDSTFDGDGRVLTNFSSNNYDAAYALALQPDGKIVAAGYSTDSSNHDFALARYNADGSLDPSFGQEGKVTTPIGSSYDFGYALALQPDGKIIVAGSSYNDNSAFALARYNTDGSLDSHFGQDGKVITQITNGTDRIDALILQPDNKIVVAGITEEYTLDFTVARYLNPTNDDVAGLWLPATLTATEGTTITYQLHLSSQPTAPVTITLTTEGQTKVNPKLLSFVPMKWSQAQTVTVVAVDDGLKEGSHSGTITHTMTSADPNYNSLGSLPLRVKLEEQKRVPGSSVFLPILLRK